MKKINLKSLRVTVEHLVSLPLTVSDYVEEIVEKLGPTGAYVKPASIDTAEQEAACHKFFLKHYLEFGNELDEEDIYYPFVSNIKDEDLVGFIVKYFYDDDYADEILSLTEDSHDESSDVIVRYPDSPDDRREIVMSLDDSVIDDYGDFEAMEKLNELMQSKHLTQNDLLIVLNAVKLK